MTQLYRIHVSVPQELVEAAKIAGVNLSAVCRLAIQRAVGDLMGKDLPASLIEAWEQYGGDRRSDRYALIWLEGRVRDRELAQKLLGRLRARVQGAVP